jgi:hypothetical protein
VRRLWPCAVAGRRAGPSEQRPAAHVGATITEGRPSRGGRLPAARLLDGRLRQLAREPPGGRRLWPLDHQQPRWNRKTYFYSLLLLLQLQPLGAVTQSVFHIFTLL